MKSIIIIITLSLTNTLRTLAQADIDTAGRLIANADSVILISHVTTEENHNKPLGRVVPPEIADNTKTIVFPSFFVKEDINPAIIVQRQSLPTREISTLANIILKPVKYGSIAYSSLCFEPHHAILIYTKGRLSYIDLCFHCSDLVTSSDLKLTNMDFEDGKWEEIEAFFLKHGLTYEMEDNH